MALQPGESTGSACRSREAEAWAAQAQLERTRTAAAGAGLVACAPEGPREDMSVRERDGDRQWGHSQDATAQGTTHTHPAPSHSQTQALPQARPQAQGQAQGQARGQAQGQENSQRAASLGHPEQKRSGTGPGGVQQRGAEGGKDNKTPKVAPQAAERECAKPEEDEDGDDCVYLGQTLSAPTTLGGHLRLPPGAQPPPAIPKGGIACSWGRRLPLRLVAGCSHVPVPCTFLSCSLHPSSVPFPSCTCLRRFCIHTQAGYRAHHTGVLPEQCSLQETWAWGRESLTSVPSWNPNPQKPPPSPSSACICFSCAFFLLFFWQDGCPALLLEPLSGAWSPPRYHWDERMPTSCPATAATAPMLSPLRSALPVKQG